VRGSQGWGESAWEVDNPPVKNRKRPGQGGGEKLLHTRNDQDNVQGEGQEVAYRKSRGADGSGSQIKWPSTGRVEGG